MPSIPLPSDGELPQSVAQRLAQLPALNIFRLLALVPECFGHWVDLVNGIYETDIDPRLREIAICRYGARTRAPYELFQHTPLARQQHVSQAELETILHAETVDSLDDAANFTCGVVDEFEDTASLSEPARAELLARFGRRTATAFLVLLGHYSCVCRFLNASGIPLEPQSPLEDAGSPIG